MEKEILAAIEVLRQGGLILYPTDTVWGIGCDATNAEAVEKIYKLKQSENKNSMIVLCHDADMVVRYVNKAPGIAFEVMEMSEKPITLILQGAVGVAPNLVPEDGTLGVRVPRHDFCQQALLRKFGKPIVSTSANISGEPTPLKGLKDVSREIIDGVDFVVNPRFQGKPSCQPSSIVAFGAFVEILPGKDGLLHISEIGHRRYETMEETGLKEGDMIDVKLIAIDQKTNKLKLSRKVLLPKK